MPARSAPKIFRTLFFLAFLPLTVPGSFFQIPLQPRQSLRVTTSEPPVGIGFISRLQGTVSRHVLFLDTQGGGLAGVCNTFLPRGIFVFLSWWGGPARPSFPLNNTSPPFWTRFHGTDRVTGPLLLTFAFQWRVARLLELRYITDRLPCCILEYFSCRRNTPPSSSEQAPYFLDIKSFLPGNISEKSQFESLR